MPDKIDLLFDDLQSRGYAKDKTRQQFRDYMLAPGKQGYENRKTFFEDFKSNGETDLGTYEDFKGLLGLHAVKKQSTQPANTGASASLQQRKETAKQALSGGTQRTSTPPSSQQQTPTPMQLPEGFGQLNTNLGETEEQRIAREASYGWTQDLGGQIKKSQDTTIHKALHGDREASKAVEKQTRKRLQQRLDEAEYEKETGKQLRNTGVNFSFEAPTIARDENGEMLRGENGEPLIGRTTDEAKVQAHQQVKKEQEEYKSIEDQLKEAYAEEERIKNLMEKDKKGRELLDNLIMSGGYDPTMSQENSNVLGNRNTYNNALRQVERRIKELEAARDDAGFFRGVKNTLTDQSSYSFGLTDIEDAKQLKKIKDKIDEAKRNGTAPNLTDGEQTFVDNYLKNEEAEQLNAENWWYNAGQGFGETLSFMKDFAVTGGGFANIAKAGMRAGAKGGAKAASQLLGNYMTKNLGTKALGKTIEYSGKAAGLMAGAEAGGFLLNNTVQAASSAADILNRQTGNLTYDKDGNLTFKGGKSLGEAILTSQISRTGENGSELVGLAFDAMPGILGRVIQRTTAGKVLKRITDNKFWKKGEKGLDFLGVQSVWGEGMEEEYGMARTEILNTITNGNYDSNGSGLFDLDRQIDTWKTVGLTSMILRVPSMIVSGTQAANYYANRYNLNTSDNNMRETFDNTERYSNVKNMIDNADNKQIAGVLSNLMKNAQLSTEEKRAIMLYANDLVKMRGFNIGNVVAAANGYQAPPRVSNYNIRGLHVDAVDEKGNVLESYDYKSQDELKTGLYEMQQKRADEKLQSDIGIMKSRPDNQFFEFALQFMESNPDYAVYDNYDDFVAVLNKPSMERTEEEQQMVAAFADQLHNAVYDNTILHEEQSQQDGEELADSDSIDIEEDSEQGKPIVDGLSTATENRLQLFANNEELKTEVEEMEKKELPHQEIISNLETFRPEEVQGMIDYYNAKAKYDGYMTRKAQRIDEEASQDRERRTFTGTINGNENKENLVTITDGENTYTLVSGNITTDKDGRVTGTDSGLMIGLDENGDFVNISDKANVSIVPSGMTLQEYEGRRREELQVALTQKIDSEQRLMPQEQSGDTTAPTETNNIVTESTDIAPSEAETPQETALDRIPKDEGGNPLYEQGAAEDTYDVFSEMTGSEEGASALAQSELNDANKRLKKLQKEQEEQRKGKFKGKTIQEKANEMKETAKAIKAEEGRIKYWNSVLAVPQNRRLEAENNPPAETPTTPTPPVDGVPEYRYDTPQAARQRGYKVVEGNRIDRQEEKEMPKGMEVEVQYSTKDKVKGHLTVSELDEVQGSHLTNGQRNEKHFLPEAQPKAEFGTDRQAAAQTNASEANFRPELMITFNGTQSAYSGSASQTNRRGEVIQGNGRRNLAEYIYAPGNEAVAKKYKDFLKAHAAELGTTAEEIDKMEKPFAHIVLDVTDAEAIRLGQFTAQDLESGGKKVPEISNVTTKLGGRYSNLANIILNHEDPDASLSERIEANAETAVKWLNNAGVINNTEAKTLLEDKALARQFLKDVITDQLFKDAHPDLRTMFYELPKNIQSAIISVVGREVAIENGKSILKDIQDSIRAYHELIVSSPEFANAQGANFEKRYAAASAAVNDWLRQINMDGTVNSEKFSNFALELAKLYKSLKDQKTLAGKLREYYDIMGNVPREGGLFDTSATSGAMTREQALEQIFGIKNGTQRTMPVAGHNQEGETGGEGGTGNPQSGERDEGEGGPSDNRGGGTGNAEEVEDLDDPEGIGSRISEDGETVEEPSANGTVYKQDYLIDGKHKVTKVDEPDAKRNYTGSYYMFDGKRYGDLNEIVREIDSRAEGKPSGTGAQSREDYLASHPLTEAQIMADTEATEDEKLNAIDFLKGEDDSAIYRFYYDGIYERAQKAEAKPKPAEKKPTPDPMAAIEQAAQSFREGQKTEENKPAEEKKEKRSEQKSKDQQDIDDALKEFNDFLDNAKGSNVLDKFMRKGLEGNYKAQTNLLDAFTLTNDAQRMFLKDLLRFASKVGYAYIKSGVHDVQEWSRKMSGSIGKKLKEVLGWDDAIVGEFVDEVWNQKYTVDGQRMRMSEHAERLKNGKGADTAVNVNKNEDNEAENVVSSQQKPASELEGDSAEFADRQYKLTQLSKKIKAKLHGIVNWGDQPKPLSAYKQIAKELSIDNLSDTDLQELIETEVVNLAREIANKEGLTDEKKFQKIVKLYEGQPSLNARDNDRINLQQYSTPAPMAYLMGLFTSKDKKVESGLEPSAGNGMLTINLPKEKMQVNDIDEMRLSNLQKQGFGEVTSQDGTQSFGGKKYDVIVTNPPFGNVTPKVYDGLYEISGLEHQMAINALESMKDDGRAAIIIGGNTEYNQNGSIKGKDRVFLNYLYAHYNVVDVINMDGKTLYSRQGTGYPVRMILINGRKEFNAKDFAPVQSKARAERVNSYEELFKRVNDDILSDKNKPASVHDTESGTSNGKHDNGHAEGTAQTGVRELSDGGSTKQSPVLAPNGRGVQRVSDTTEPEGRGTANGEGTGVVGKRVSVLHTSGTETTQHEGSKTSSAEPGGRGRSVASGGVDSERQAGDSDVPVGVGQRGAGASRPVQQPEQKRGLSTEKVPYKKQSGNPFTLDSLMPAEQADEVKKILEELGDVDQFLVDELGYANKEELHRALAAEQIDSVAMAIHQMNQGNAFIIGDMTGIGKGRQAAALIRYGVKKGGCPVFITVKKGLFSDMYRDLCDIGSPGLRPFIWCAKDKDKSQDITDADGNVVYKWSEKEQKRVAEYILKNGKLPPEYDYIVTTYDGFKSGTLDYENGQKKARNFGKGKSAGSMAINGQSKRDALEVLARNSYVIMDESHNAGGDKSNVSKFLQYITAITKGTTFLSATFAKRPENMPIYALRTAISKAGVKIDELIAAVKKGGATFQEVMSKALTGAGQMIRRERNMEGVTIDWKGIEDEDIIQKQREQYDTIIGLFNDIINFQRTYVDPIVNGMNDAEAEVQGAVDHTLGTRDMGINNTPFASRTYNMVQQVLLSLKAEEAGKRAVEHLKAGRKPVIAVANTNEGAADEAVGMSEEDLEMPDLSINLKKGLQGTLRITKKDAFGNETNEMIPFDRLSEEGQKRYAEIMDAIESASSGLSLSPIDVIKNELKKAGYKVGELTGRKAEFVYNSDGTVKRVKRTDTDKKKTAANFNNGTLDALIINRSAGTGISLHASSRFKDQRQRIMIVAQAQGDVNDEVQMRGRIDRTGQVLRGMYEYVVSQIPSEQRLLMMLKAKLRSLDANTTSSQKSKFNEMQVQDIINKYGDDIVIQYLSEHPDLAVKMVDPLKWGESLGDGYETMPPETLVTNAKKQDEQGQTASKVLGRMALLTVREQEKMLAEIGDLYQAEIDRLNEMGENDLEITEMPLRAKTIRKDVWEQGVDPNGNNPFADNSYVEKVQMDVLKKPMKAEEVKRAQAHLLGGKTWDEYKKGVLERVDDWAENKKKETTDTITARAEKKAKAEQERYVKGAKKAQAKNSMTDEEIEKNGQFQYKTIYEQEMTKLDNALDAINKQKQVFIDVLELFDTDRVFALPSNIYDLSSMTFEPGMGKLIDVKISDNFSTTASTISFATLDGRRKITIPVSGMVKQQNNEKRSVFPVIVSLTAQTKNGMFGSNVANTLRVLEQNIDNLDKLTSSAARKDGYIITGNLLKALVSTREQGVGGKLISYTTDTGEVRQGILMPDNFDPKGLTSKTPISSRKEELKYSRDEVVSADGEVKVRVTNDWDWSSRGYNTLELIVPKSKKKGERYFNDEVLLGLMNGQFEGSGKMKAEFPRTNLDAVMKRLDELGVTVTEENNDNNSTVGTGRRYDEDIDEEVVTTSHQSEHKSRIAKHIDNLVKKLGTKTRTVVYHSFDELPEDMKEHVRKREKQGRKVRGWYENGRVYLYLPHIDSVYQAEKTIWHETVAHHGLRQLIGEENLNKLLKQLWLTHRDGEMGKWVTERMQRNGWALNEAIEEYLAREAEKNPFKEPGLWQRIKWMLADALHKIGFATDPTISDIQYLFWVSQNRLREGDALSVAKQQAFLHRLERAATTTPHRGQYVNMNAEKVEDIYDPNAEGAYDDGTRYSEETDEEIIDDAKKNGTYMKAPNGKKSNLSPKQWVRVRTEAFKNWFGDWINDPANASKVLDENGEPMVVYHSYDNSNYDSGLVYMSADKNFSGEFGSNIDAVFVNIRNPYIAKDDILRDAEGNVIMFEGEPATIGYLDSLPSDYILWLQSNYDGVIGDSNTFVVAFEANQIKSATENVGTYDRKNKDIRYDEDIEEPLAYSAKKVYDERLNRVETVFSEAYQDAMVSLKTAQNAIAKDKEIPDSQNAYMAENLMHGKNKNEQDLYNRMFRDPLIRTINKIMNLTGMNWGDIDRYVYTKSGLERNREFFVRDWLAKERKKTIKRRSSLNETEKGIYDRMANRIETDFEDGLIATEEEKNKKLTESLQKAHEAFLDKVESDWQHMKEARYHDLENGYSIELTVDNFTYADYLNALSDFIRNNVDNSYNPSEHDYSGFRAMFGDAEGKYDETEIIDELMETEATINTDPDGNTTGTVDELWEQIRAATRYGLERYREAGMRSDEQIDQVEQMFHWYVPMRGFKGDRGEDMYQYFTGKGRTKNYVGGLLKHAKGRGSEANYPISTIFAMTYKAISDCNQNLVNQKLYRLCQSNPNDLIVLSDSWAVLNEQTGLWEESSPEIPADASEEDVREATLAWEEQMKELANENKSMKITGKPRFDYVPMDKQKKSEHEIDVRINGKPRKMIVTGNPRMAQALNGQLRFENGRNIFSKWNANIKNFMASLFTSYSPTFALRNLFRDWTHFRMMLGVREGEGYAKQANKYYRQTLFKMVGLFKKYREGTLDENNEVERDFKDFMDNGGITGFVFMQKIDDIQKEMKKLYEQQKEGKAIKLNNKLWDYTLGAIEAVNEGIENNARFATYRASRHYAQRTKARSAYDAKEITVNFNRKGAGSKTAGFKSQSKAVEDAAKAFGVTSQILGEGRIFFNATVQAIATTFKNFQNSDGSLNKPYIAKWAGRYAIPPFMFGLALPLINKALAAAFDGDDDDDAPYANLAEWTRRKNICIYIGNNNFITIPIGQELAAFLTLGDIFAGNTYAQELKPVDKGITDELLGAMNTFSPVDIDTKITKGGLTKKPLDEVIGRTFSVLAPLVAVQQNVGWTGRPIYREDLYKDDKYTPEYQMVYNSTNPVLVSASKYLHELGGGDDVVRGKEWSEVNPAIVQYLWEQYTGGPGKVFANTISIGKDLKDLFNGETPDFNMRKVEGLKAFVQQGDDRTSYYRVNAKWRKYKEDAEALKNKIKGYEGLSEVDPTARSKYEKLSKSKEFVRMDIALSASKYLNKMNKYINKAEGSERNALKEQYNKRVKEVVDMLDSVK